ncbi:DUF5996 family protein [soil metagenome]
MAGAWPTLPWPAWRETAQHLHLLTQIVGKIRLARTPWLNHSWHVTLTVSSRGFTTGPIPIPGGVLEIEFDFLDSRLIFTTSNGATSQLPLEPGSVATFHRDVLAALDMLEIAVAISDRPSELPDGIPFAKDHAHRPYDAEAVRDFWRALIRIDRIFREFRTGFLGKASPVHFFWGSFDLAVTRFSGRVAPKHPGGFPGLPDAVTCEAYSHEEASVGFWPGSDAFPEAAFYAYAYPSPEGFADAKVQPEAARFDAGLGEFILPYAAVRTAGDPDAVLLAFLQSTYNASADLAGWDRAALECPLGAPRVPRAV